MYPQTVTFTCSGADHTPPIPDEVITNAFTVTVTPHPDAPSAPRAPDAPDVPLTAAAGSLTVKWKTPSNLGDPSSLSAYHVRHRVKAGPGAWLPDVDGAEVMLANNNQAAPGSYTISGLAAVEYEVEVRATNGNISPWYSAGSETPLFVQATVAFADTELRVGEGVSTPEIGDPGLRVLGVRVTLQLSRPALAALTAVITPTNVTASDADYTRAPITINIAAGASSASGNLLITNDAFPEPDETLTLAITTAPDGFSATGAADATVTIIDNNRATARIAFHAGAAFSRSQFTLQIAEDVPGGLIMVPVAISHIPEVDAEFAIDIEDGGTATLQTDDPGDFIHLSQTLTFPAGDATLTRNAEFSLTDDNLVEGNEIFRIRIRAAGTSGTNPAAAGYAYSDLYRRHPDGSSAAITITDDDSDDARLSGLSAEAGGAALPLTPSAFAAGTRTYTAMAATDAARAEILPVVNHENATYTVNNLAPDNPGEAVAVDLAHGVNAILVVVTADDALTTATYTLRITRSSTAATAPQTVSLVPEAGGIAAAWDAPLSNGGSAVSGWRIRWREAVQSGAENPWQDEDGDQENGHLLADADARAYTIAGLTDAAEYDVEAAAITDFGIGLWSAAQSAV
ncbi:MAG: cadherin-like beta sandwich domain-containing protein, partial [Gammaproteobacteria bacterium]